MMGNISQEVACTCYVFNDLTEQLFILHLNLHCTSQLLPLKTSLGILFILTVGNHDCIHEMKYIQISKFE